MKKPSEMIKLVSRLKDVERALELHVEGIQAHARGMVDSHAAAAQQHAAAEDARRRSVENITRMFDWFSKPKDDES